MPSPIDRTYPLADFRYGRANPNRVHVVIRRDPETRAAVWRGTRRLREFVEHERAMTWAHKVASADEPSVLAYVGSSQKPTQDGLAGAASGPNYTRVISGPQNGSDEFAHPKPMEAP